MIRLFAPALSLRLTPPARRLRRQLAAVARAEERRPLRREGPADRVGAGQERRLEVQAARHRRLARPASGATKFSSPRPTATRSCCSASAPTARRSGGRSSPSTGEARSQPPGPSLRRHRVVLAPTASTSGPRRRQRQPRLLHIDGKPVWNKDLQKYGKYNIQFGMPLDAGAVQGQALPPGHAPQRPEARLPRRGHRQGRVGGRPRGLRQGSEHSPDESPDVYASAFIWEGEGGPLLVAHGNDYCTGHKLDDGSEVWRVQGLNPTSNGAWRFVSCPLRHAGPDRRAVVQERADGRRSTRSGRRGTSTRTTRRRSCAYRRRTPSARRTWSPRSASATSCTSPAMDHSGRSMRRPASSSIERI